MIDARRRVLSTRRRNQDGARMSQRHRAQRDGPQIAIVGAGFSGLLTAVNLLQASPAVRVTLIERRGVFGPGTAYDTGNPQHLLNVRLDNMSAFPDRPGHLADWLAEQPSWRAQDGFITRGVYGDYLQSLLDAALEDAPERLTPDRRRSPRAGSPRRRLAHRNLERRDRRGRGGAGAGQSGAGLAAGRGRGRARLVRLCRETPGGWTRPRPRRRATCF